MLLSYGYNVKKWDVKDEEKILKTVADVAVKTAYKAGRNASWYGFYQAKKPEALKNKIRLITLKRV